MNIELRASLSINNITAFTNAKVDEIVNTIVKVY